MGALCVAERLSKNQTILYINISSNNIGDTGALYLAAALEHNRTLHTLDVRENDISEDGLRMLIEAFTARGLPFELISI